MWKIALICQPHKKGIMKKINWKKILPHAIAVTIFLVVTLIYCSPALEGKVVQQHDVTQWQGMVQNQLAEKNVTGVMPLWSNGMFGGMPGYMISQRNNITVPYYFVQALSLFLNKPFQFFFLASICFYFLSQVLRVRPWIGIVGALCYAYATYNPVIVAAGHDTKMMSLALIPGLLGSLMLIFDKKYWSGAALTALFTAALLMQGHYQIVYYTFIVIGFMSLAYIIRWVRNKEFKQMFIALAFAFVAGAIGSLNIAVTTLTNFEYTKESIRGGSQLVTDSGTTKKAGMGKDYAFSYSMYKSEPFVMMVPHMFGGRSYADEKFMEKSKGAEALQGAPKEVGQQLYQIGIVQPYWGGIDGVGTAGPPYIGAIICFLALIGFAIADNKHKWWILAVSILTIVMSWGGYFEAFNGMLLKTLPMYNSFRAPSMIITMPTLLLNILAIISLQQIVETTDKAALLKKYKNGLLITVGVLLFLVILYFSFDYKGSSDRMIIKQINDAVPDANAKTAFLNAANATIKGLQEDRRSMFGSDLFRSFIFILLAAGTVWLAIKKKLQDIWMVVIVGVLAFADIMMIDVKYLGSENYQVKEDNESSFIPSAADKFILEDKSQYRVLDVSTGIRDAFNAGASIAYFHQTIGGYHPAKLSIYQDLIENQLYKYPNCQPVLDMLNTKYIIHGRTNAQQVEPNPRAAGQVWFVKNIRTVEGPKQEMEALNYLSVKDSAVADKSFASIVSTPINYDSTASIQIVKRENDVVTYKTKAISAQFAVFSEIYYDKGWNAYIDGKATPYARVNYVLRGMPIPAGEHEVVFKFEPKSHSLGWTLTAASTWLTVLLCLAAIFFAWKKKDSNQFK
jgi:hypothetical protein